MQLGAAADAALCLAVDQANTPAGHPAIVAGQAQGNLRLHAAGIGRRRTRTLAEFPFGDEVGFESSAAVGDDAIRLQDLRLAEHQRRVDIGNRDRVGDARDGALHHARIVVRSCSSSCAAPVVSSHQAGCTRVGEVDHRTQRVVGRVGVSPLAKYGDCGKDAFSA